MSALGFSDRPRFRQIYLSTIWVDGTCIASCVGQHRQYDTDSVVDGTGNETMARGKKK